MSSIFNKILVILFIMGSAQNFGQSSQLKSMLEIFSLETGERKVIYEEKAHFEAPNWSPDGNYLIFNQNGLLYKIKTDGSSKEQLDTGTAVKCNNDHGISPDGTMLAISNNDPIEGVESGTSRIYTLPIEGGDPKLVTLEYPSYWHGWSPESDAVVYTARRNNNYDIYRISIHGGEEERLTNSPGLDDGPEYSPEGSYIYYNSMQSGSMEIWRMKDDGSKKEQLTNDAYSNWFAHPSPDGKYFVFISYLQDQGDRHPPLKDVALRLYHLNTKEIKSLCFFTGGQGTINVPSWSPDSKHFAFVSYENQ
jgi:Tol biopolymer transport system component